MLIPISNTPRDYSWGSTDLIAHLQGRTPTGRPEAEIWYGDHSRQPLAGARRRRRHARHGTCRRGWRKRRRRTF
ncbi:MAG: hypothetical protein R2692_01045 [Microbacterium sp.]